MDDFPVWPSENACVDRPDSPVPWVSERVWRAVQLWPQAKAAASLTYAQLWSRAQQVARRIGPGGPRVAAVCTRRDQDAAVGFLACQLSGCRYLPLDLDLPLARLELMVSQTAPEVTLASAGMEKLLPWVNSAVSLEPSQETRAPKLAGPASPGAGYILFTSGTTGAPQAVTVEARSLDSYAEALVRYFQPAVGEVAIHTASLAFSASIRQLLLPLSSGGRLLFADQASRQNPEMLLDLIQVEAVNVLDTVPSHLRALTRALERNSRREIARPWVDPDPGNLRTVGCRFSESGLGLGL